jgi:hypothetical protein
MKKIPTWTITLVALILSIVLAANFIKANKDTAKQAKEADPEERVLIIAKSNFTEIENALKDYPEKLPEKEAVRQGFIVIRDEKLKSDGAEIWNRFCEKIRKKKDGAVMICQYTAEGDPILQYVSFKDGAYYFVEDATRDPFGNGKCQSYTYGTLKRFEEKGKYNVALTKKKDLTYEQMNKADNPKETKRLFSVDMKAMK